MSTKTNLILDLTMLGAFLVVSNPKLTGGTIHEWLAVSFAGVVITHLLLHWNWIVKVGREFFRKLFHRSRLNFIVNALFFITMTGALFSGLLISESVLSTLGIHLAVSRAWKSIHTLMSDAALILLGIHFALHWKWVVTNIRRHLLNPFLGSSRRHTRQPVLTAQPVRVKDSQ